MASMGPFVTLALYLLSAVATLGIGAFLLRSAVQDALELASQLPTRPASEDTSEAREANRRKALIEIMLLLVVRMAPGGALVLCGIFLVIWAFCKSFTAVV